MPIGVTEVVSSETAADYLYGLAAGEFVAARDQLVRALRAAGRRELAAEVKALRRPTLLAAELNRALRAGPGELGRLLEAAAALRHGHERLLAGDPVDLAALRSTHRDAAGALAARAERHRDAIGALLERASLDEAQHPELRAAVFEREPSPAIGFDVLGPVPDLAPGTSGTREAPPAGPVPPSRDPAGDGVSSGRLPGQGSSGRLAGEGRPGGHLAGEGMAGGDLAGEGRPGDELPPPGGGSDRGAQDRASRQAASVVRDRAVGTHDEAVHALALARRRLDAAARGEERAATRVAELEQRLVEARRHRDDSGLKLEQARTAIQRAEARVEDASTGLERAEADLARIPPDGPERSSG
jgi:hypothetical protein